MATIRYAIYSAQYHGNGTTSSEATGASISDITVASPAVVTSAGHGLSADAPIYLNGTLPTGLSTTTLYYVRNPSTDTFEVSLTAGGASVNTTGGADSGASWNNAAGAWMMEQVAASPSPIIFNNSPTRGTLPTDTIVYIRSKTGNGADANITQSLGASVTMGNSSATTAARIRWVLDNGTIWSGVNGTLTVESSTTPAYNITASSNNDFHAMTDHNWIIKLVNPSSSGNKTVITVGSCHLTGLQIDYTAHTSSYTTYVVGLYYNQPIGAVCTNLKVVAGRSRTTTGAGVSVNMYNTLVTFINPVFVFDDTSSDGGNVWAFNNAGGSGSGVVVYGGEVTGAAVVSGTVKIARYEYSTVEMIGFKFPLTAQHDSNDYSQYYNVRVNEIGCDGLFGTLQRRYWGNCSSRNDSNFPTLNAAFPDSVPTPWSWKMYVRLTEDSQPGNLTITKVYQQTAGAKVVTMNIAPQSTYDASLNAGNCWMTVLYTDSGGTRRCQSTRSFAVSPAGLSSSAAVWSPNPPYWGEISCTARKLELTTDYSIAQDSLVIATLFVNQGGASTSEVVFVCPELILTDV